MTYRNRWFSPGTPVSFINKTDRHDIAEILMKVALKHQKSNQINQVTLDKYQLLVFFSQDKDYQVHIR